MWGVPWLPPEHEPAIGDNALFPRPFRFVHQAPYCAIICGGHIDDITAKTKLRSDQVEISQEERARHTPSLRSACRSRH
jgi:hypothetical protein